jgi:hypothetical protein
LKLETERVSNVTSELVILDLQEDLHRYFVAIAMMLETTASTFSELSRNPWDFVFLEWRRSPVFTQTIWKANGKNNIPDK